MSYKLTFPSLLMSIVLGVLIGSVLGQLVGLLLPTGIVKEFFLRSAQFGFSPTTLNLALIQITLGFTFKLNIIGVIGIFLATYIFRWYH